MTESDLTGTQDHAPEDESRTAPAANRIAALGRVSDLRRRLLALRRRAPPVLRWIGVGVGILLSLVVAAAVAAVAVVSIGRRRFERETRHRIERLTTTVERRPSERYDPSHVTDLPAPVQRYFQTVLTPGQPLVRAVELTQAGEMRLDDGGDGGEVDAAGAAGDREDPGDAWRPLTATQHYTVHPPGFVWDAEIEVMPYLSARVVDAYEHGKGSLDARLLSTIQVASAEPSPAMNESELLRYLGEAVWFPTALLPAEGVKWEAIDDQTAKATIHDHATTASLVFHFDDDGLVDRVTTPARYRQGDDDYAPWTGYYSEYEYRNGMLVPTHAAAEWNLPDGDHQYWRADVTDIHHQTAHPTRSR